MLFTRAELASYMQVPAVNEDTADLLSELAEWLIVDALGGTLPAPLPPRLKRIGLEVVKRAYLNPNGYVRETLPDGYSYDRGGRGTAEALEQTGIYLTAQERQEVAGGAVRTRSAFSVKPGL